LPRRARAKSLRRIRAKQVGAAVNGVHRLALRPLGRVGAADHGIDVAKLLEKRLEIARAQRP
jgi:hypothetical protein